MQWYFFTEHVLANNRCSLDLIKNVQETVQLFSKCSLPKKACAPPPLFSLVFQNARLVSFRNLGWNLIHCHSFNLFFALELFLVYLLFFFFFEITSLVKCKIFVAFSFESSSHSLAKQASSLWIASSFFSLAKHCCLHLHTLKARYFICLQNLMLPKCIQNGEAVILFESFVQVQI